MLWMVLLLFGAIMKCCCTLSCANDFLWMDDAVGTCCTQVATMKKVYGTRMDIEKGKRHTLTSQGMASLLPLSEFGQSHPLVLVTGTEPIKSNTKSFA